MPTIHILQTGQKITCEAGEELLHILLRNGAMVEKPCGGNGSCGKCRVRIVSGEASPITEDERQLLRSEDIENGIRLSCMTRVCGDMDIEMPHREAKHRVLAKGYMPPFVQDHFDGGYGVAIDIGTTTVVLSLIDRRNGQIIADACRINEQKCYGLDVLSRITYEYQHPESGVKDLQRAIVESLNRMLEEVCTAAGIALSDIAEITVAANCTMTHMLLGEDARSIGRAPYAPAFTSAQKRNARDIGLNTDAALYCLPQVSAYIGADIVAGAYVCDLHKAQGNVLFIDIGTNGEIVLASNGRLLCCSCAAGPALEGANIRCGMRASEGAIEDLTITPDSVELKTIGDTEPVGLCGSGILAAIRELLRTKLVKPSGVFIKTDAPGGERLRCSGTKREMVLHQEPEILITQDDVRQVQLAKGAILSGFMALLQRAGITMADLDRVLVAGQFGAHLSAQSLVGTGILPREVEDKLTYVGNSSKTGAYMALLSRTAREEMEKLAQRMEYMELAETKDYEALLAGCMIFPK